MTRYDTSNITVDDLANHLRTVVFPKLGDLAVAYAKVLNNRDLIDAYAVAVYGKPVFMTPEEYERRANHKFTQH